MHLSILLLISTFFISPSFARTISQPPPKIRWINCADAVPGPTTTASLNISAIDLTNLPSTLHCGLLDVPMDYSKPMCETNMVTLGLAMHRPVNPKGALFFNPGGTDAGVIIAWDIALNVTRAFDDLLDFDILVFDLRGTYSSGQLRVDLDTIAPFFGPYPTTRDEYDTIKNASATALRSWIDHSSPPGIIQHVGTREVVQDYEQVRKALGYEKINFLGASDGTFRAVKYASMFPERVDRFVLDSAVPHGLPYFQQGLDQIAATNRIMQRADAYCLNNSSCPFYGQGKGSLLKAFKQLLAKVKGAPFFVPECVNTTICYPYVAQNDVQLMMNNRLQVVPDFPVVLDGLYAALNNGDPTIFVNGPVPLEAAVAMPLLCNDYAIDRTFESFQKSVQEGLKNDITGIGMTQLWVIEMFCSAWPYHVPENKPLPLHKEMLFVTADFDPSSPTEWTTYAWEKSPKSTLVVRHGDDHVSFLLPDQPSSKITTAFLNTGIMPKAQESEFLSVYTPGMKRKPIADPYTVVTGALAGDIDSGNVTVEVPF